MKYILIITLFLLLNSCVYQEGAESRSVKKSENFTVHYYSYDFTSAEIDAYIERKEVLLQRLEELFSVPYDTIITTWLYDYSPGGRFAYYTEGETFESDLYVRYDSGHEIAHAYTFRLFGESQTKAVVEGMADYLEYRFNGTSAVDLFRELTFDEYAYRSQMQTLEYLFLHGRDVETFGVFEYSQCGAFFEFLVNNYGGIETVREIWEKSVYSTGYPLLTSIQDVCGVPFRTLENEFYALTLPESWQEYFIQ